MSTKEQARVKIDYTDIYFCCAVFEVRGGCLQGRYKFFLYIYTFEGVTFVNNKWQCHATKKEGMW